MTDKEQLVLSLVKLQILRQMAERALSELCGTDETYFAEKAVQYLQEVRLEEKRTETLLSLCDQRPPK